MLDAFPIPILDSCPSSGNGSSSSSFTIVDTLDVDGRGDVTIVVDTLLVDTLLVDTIVVDTLLVDTLAEEDRRREELRDTRPLFPTAPCSISSLHSLTHSLYRSFLPSSPSLRSTFTPLSLSDVLDSDPG